MRAITAQRFLSAYALTQGVSFTEDVDGQPVVHDPLIVLSPVCFLPAVIAFARSLSNQVLGSGAEAVLEISTQTKQESLLGVQQNVGPLDSSVAGIFRTLILSRGFDLMCSAHVGPQGRIQLERLEAFFLSPEGRSYIAGTTDIALDLPDEVAQDVLRHSLPQS